MEYKIISADNHINEPPGTFVDRVPAHLKDKAPRILAAENGGEGWSWDGKPPKQGFGLNAVAGRSFENYKNNMKFEEILPGNYDPKAHIEDNAKDGVDAAVVYPMAALGTYTCPDRELALACVRAYNDWLLDDFCAVDPGRLISIPVLPVDDGMDVVIEELKRVAKKGARGVFIPGCPQKPYHDTYYDPLWAETQEHGLAVNIHRNHGGQAPALDSQDQQVAGIVIRFFASIRPLTNMIFSGVFDRFPNQQAIAAETNIGWAPFWIEEMENEFTRQRHWANLTMTRTPREYVERNVRATFLEDKVGFAAFQFIPDRFPMYSTDYPHSVTIWPRSREVTEDLTKGLSPEVKHKVLAGNAVEAYHLA